MFRLISTCVSLAFLTGCGAFGPPCDKAYKAVDACVLEYSGEENASGEYAAFCDEEDECMDDYYSCMADAYRAADCSTAQGVSAAAAEAANCINTADISSCE